MSSKRNKESAIHKVPFDCWCEVVIFLDEKRDFLSFVLTIKGLYDYICNTMPQCTENIEFSSKTLATLPHSTKNKKYVSWISLGDEENGIGSQESFLNEINTDPKMKKDDDSFFKYLKTVFPNLKLLNLQLRGHHNAKADKNPPELQISPLPNLEELHLRISQTNLSLPFIDLSKFGYFKNLHILILINNLYIYEKENRYDVPKDYFDMKLLSIDVKSIPNLVNLELCGWKLNNPEILELDSLQILVLENTIIRNPKNLTMKPTKIRNLELYSQSICNQNDFQKRYPNLERLIISPNYHKFPRLEDQDSYLELVIDVYRPKYKMNFKIKDLQELEEIEIVSEYAGHIKVLDSTEEVNNFEFINLPKLKNLRLDSSFSDSRNIVIQNTPMIEKISISIQKDYHHLEVESPTFVTFPINASCLKDICILNVMLDKYSSSLLQTFKNLQVLYLDFFTDNEVDFNEFKKFEKKVVLEDMSKLRKVRVRRPYQVTKIKNCENLEQLSFSLHSKSPVLENLPKLTEKFKCYYKECGFDGGELCRSEVEKFGGQLSNCLNLERIRIERYSMDAGEKLKEEFCSSFVDGKNMFPEMVDRLMEINKLKN